jgi:CHAT domain-containing protein
VAVALPDVRAGLVVGGLEYGTGPRGSWLALEGSGRERDQVHSIWTEAVPGMRIHALSGDQATRAQVLTAAPACALLHFATHGFAREVRGETSAALALSGANADAAGVLWASDLLGTDLSACQLVVLSACDTGQGERDTGEAVAGLNRALLLAGARATITSLWPIPDAEAPRFFRAFYDHLLARRMTPEQALSATRRLLRREGVSPATWAGFVLYRGAPR